MIQWAAEGLRPHSAIGAASGVTAPPEGRPAKDFSNWSCDTLDSSSVCDRGPRKNPGAFFVSDSSAEASARAGVRGAAGAANPPRPARQDASCACGTLRAR